MNKSKKVAPNMNTLSLHITTKKRNTNTKLVLESLKDSSLQDHLQKPKTTFYKRENQEHEMTTMDARCVQYVILKIIVIYWTYTTRNYLT